MMNPVHESPGVEQWAPEAMFHWAHMHRSSAKTLVIFTVPLPLSRRERSSSSVMSLQVESSWWRTHLTWRTVYVLFLGQLVSFSMAVASFTSSLLADLGVNAPLTQMFFPYVLLALVYGSVFVYRRRKLLVPWYWYLLLGFIDVQGNYLVNEAYQFSSITSVTLLDCWTIVWAIIMTWFFLGSRYSILQLIGAAVSVLGLGLVMLSDAGVGGGGGSRPILGDVLVIAGTVFFAMSNVGEEFCVKKKDLVEVLTMLPLFGFLVSTVQMYPFWLEILAFAGYAVAMFAFYSLTPFVLRMSGAALFNLSLLTSDMWAVVIRIFFYRQGVDWLYYLAFSLVIIGLIVYSVTGKDPETVPSIENRTSTDYQLLNDESRALRAEDSES
ncbi:hypothetical protein CDL15_Pgr003267 [Punica granatum]|uniref:Solute carrier family 35 member F1-like n=2 Tax=Punica granatum TaxID=22663 RepID=A0A218X304_PUNGR|nr:hypothetical protein CDL15_Pgr003267 [Punica granatum]